MPKKTSVKRNNKASKRIIGRNLVTSPRFSKKSLIIFGLVFGVIGAYFVFRSFAAAPIVASLEAEQMTLATGAINFSDTTASGGQAVRFSGQGTATSSISPTSQAVSLTVRAKGNQCSGSPANNLIVEAGGKVIISKPINSTSWIDGTASVNLPAGTHAINIKSASYTQSAGNSGKVKCQNSLSVDKLTFFGVDNSPPSDINVSLKTPVNGSVVSGGLPVEAIAGGATITKVEFYLDDALQQPVELAAPYCMMGDTSSVCNPWDSKSVANGTHKIMVKAYDNAPTPNTATATVSFTVSNTTSNPGQLTSTLIGTHPYASAQWTAPGKVLTGLQEFNGKLYMGYGDTSANTGPIRITAFNSSTNSFVTEYTSATEAIWTYRPLGNRLFAPSDDPQGDFSTDFTVGTPWGSNSSVRTTHNFDMAQLGSTLYTVGSRDVNAIVARSDDGGNTWTNIGTESIGGDIARYYFAAVYNNQLYVQAYGYYNNKPAASSKVFNGNSWSSGPNLLPLGGHGWHPKVFGTKLLYQTHLPNNMLANSGNDKSRLMVFNGTNASSPLSAQIYDFAINGSYVYALGIDGSILRSSDLATWTNLGQGPSSARSIGFLGTTLYAGTTDSKLYKISL